MARSFNIAGPCDAADHYMLPPERRLVHLLDLVGRRLYFVLVSGRQTGKTTSLQWLVQHLKQKGELAILVDLQVAREQPDVATAMRTVLSAWSLAVETDLPEQVPSHEAVEEWLRDPATALLMAITDLRQRAGKPLTVLFDEADGLVGPAMVSFLTQLRAGYLRRKRSPFAESVGLAGMRAVRDYVLSARDRSAVAWLGTTSPFNVAVETTTLVPFSAVEVAELLAQHTDETGQPFEQAAVAHVAELSQGHPWLVNALADQVTRRDVRDRGVPIRKEHVETAKEVLILERRTHIDSLVARLREPRVRRIVAPMIVGGHTGPDVLDDDVAYAIGLGILRERRGRLEVANPIYREVIPRALTHLQQMQIPNEPAWYVRDDGELDMPRVMAAWQSVWREDGHLAARGFAYREAGPHLMLMAFLQRVVNGGGRVQREYGLGRRALDLLIHWQATRHAVEVKLRRGPRSETLGLSQVARYLDTLGLREGWLVLFDRRKGVAWDQKITLRHETVDGRQVHVVGC